ncbi:MAG: Gfo/Idh/MocA family oxidoreductase [Cyclobacteriaceae bacterium]|nr:Gfo/Idh/MocA family oxidoreductase [Cyclobacteriaceae bacterium]
MIRFGILGPGKIARRFAADFHFVPNATITAVASRDSDRGQAFAAEFGVPVVHTSYQALVRDPDVDVIYVGTPHSFHHAHALLCLTGGKPVVCEKPLAINHKQVSEMVAAARSNNVFFMEAMWSRFFPSTQKALELVREGAIGEVKSMHADFGFYSEYNPNGRVYNLALGGGAWLDVGVYPMFLTLLMLGKPDVIKAHAWLAPTGADTSTSALFGYQHGAIAHLTSSVVANTPKHCDIVGTQGTISLLTPSHKSPVVVLARTGEQPQHFPFPYEGTGFQYQIAEVVRCMEAGWKESPLLPLDFSLLMAATSDEVRRQCGIRYPED